MKPLTAFIAGAVAIMKPADVKKMDIAMNSRKRRSDDPGDFGVADLPIANRINQHVVSNFYMWFL